MDATRQRPDAANFVARQPHECPYALVHALHQYTPQNKDWFAYECASGPAGWASCGGIRDAVPRRTMRMTNAPAGFQVAGAVDPGDGVIFITARFFAVAIGNGATPVRVRA